MNFEQRGKVESLPELLKLKAKLEAELAEVNKKIEALQGKNTESKEYFPLCRAKKDGSGNITKSEEGEPSTFMIKKDDGGNFYLFLNETVRKPTAATNDNIKEFFSLVNTGDFEEYKITKPAKLEKSGDNKWKLKSKGEVEF